MCYADWNLYGSLPNFIYAIFSFGGNTAKLQLSRSNWPLELTGKEGSFQELIKFHWMNERMNERGRVNEVIAHPAEPGCAECLFGNLNWVELNSTKSRSINFYVSDWGTREIYLICQQQHASSSIIDWFQQFPPAASWSRRLCFVELSLAVAVVVVVVVELSFGKRAESDAQEIFN